MTFERKWPGSEEPKKKKYFENENDVFAFVMGCLFSVLPVAGIIYAICVIVTQYRDHQEWLKHDHGYCTSNGWQIECPQDSRTK